MGAQFETQAPPVKYVVSLIDEDDGVVDVDCKTLSEALCIRALLPGSSIINKGDGNVA